MNKQLPWIILVVVILIVGGVLIFNNGNDSQNQQQEQSLEAMMMEKQATKDAMSKGMDSAMMQDIKEMEFDYTGKLADVSGGTASGQASASFNQEGYFLLATFENLPEPQGTDFYEGWVVRKSPFNFVSTGKVEKTDGVYTNSYASQSNLTDHNVYILTIEPDDGDPAPAGHVVEGEMFATGGSASGGENEGKMMQDDGMMAEEDKMMNGNDKMENNAMSVPSEVEGMVVKGAYVEYTPEALAKASAEGKAVLFFHAKWCPFCKNADSAFNSSLDEIPSGVTVLKTDYDTEKELQTKYGVTYQHTFVQVDAQGNMVAKWNGGDVEELKENIK